MPNYRRRHVIFSSGNLVVEPDLEDDLGGRAKCSVFRGPLKLLTIGRTASRLTKHKLAVGVSELKGSGAQSNNGSTNQLLDVRIGNS